MGEDTELDIAFLKKIKAEWVMLLLFFAVLVMFSSIFDAGRLIHETPTNLNAGDMFIFSAFGDLAKFEDDMKDLPPYISGGDEKAINVFPPISGILIAQLSDSTGAESYDFLIHLNILFLILAALAMYFLLRKINPLAAILSLPLFLLIFKWPFNSVIHWGGHIGNLNVFFIVATLYCFYHLEKRWMFIVLGLINAASFLSHGREFQTLNLAFGIYFVFLFVKNKVYNSIMSEPRNIIALFKKDETLSLFVKYVLSIAVAILVLFTRWRIMQMLLTKHTLGDEGSFAWAYKPLFHQVTFSDYGIFLYLLAVGLIISFVYLFREKNKKLDILLITALLFVLNGLVIILGNRLPTARAYSVITAMPLLFLFFAYTIEALAKGLKTDKKTTTFIVFVLIMGILLVSHTPKEIGNSSLISPLRMDAERWMGANIENAAKTIVLYCDQCGQVSIFSPSRTTYHMVIQNDYIQNIKDSVLTSTFVVHPIPVFIKYYRDASTGKISQVFDREPYENRSVCEYQYAYIEKISENDVVRQYSLLLANTLIKEAGFTIAYQNDLALILENDNVGGPCFQDKKLVVGNGK
jgi:hypothetical protein